MRIFHFGYLKQNSGHKIGESQTIKAVVRSSFFLLAWWVLPTFIKVFSHNLFYTLQAPVWTTSAKIKDLQTYWALKLNSKESLIEANRDLARINASHTLTLSENDSLKEELKQLETLLDLPKLPHHEYMLARVIRRNLASWSHQILIHKGEADGLVIGAAVIYSNGVVGRIKKMDKHTSTVELISSPTFRIAARFLGDSRPITFQGMTNAGFTNPMGRAFNIPTDVRASKKHSRKLVSSKLGGVFPDGLSLGVIRELTPGSDGLFQQATVELSEDLHNIQEVAVLLPLVEKKEAA